MILIILMADDDRYEKQIKGQDIFHMTFFPNQNTPYICKQKEFIYY